MKKIKITERQARLLENLNTKKVVKITESQYNRILELESELIKSETPIASEENKPDLFKEFIEELYNMNEENKSTKYNDLIKVMEVAGLLENNKIKRSAFNENIDEVKSRITKGLNVMSECGSPYKAVDAMLEENKEEDELAKLGDEIKNDYEKIRQSFKGQLSGKKDYVSPFDVDDDIENTYTPPVKENEDNNQAGVVGFDILDVEPFNQLPNTREDMGTWPNRLEVKLPDLESGDMSIVMFSKQDVIDYINKFLGVNNRLPEFIDIDVQRLSADIKFIDDDNTKKDRELSLNNKMRSLSDFDSIDEMDTASALGNAQPIGPIGFKSEFEEGLTDKIYEALKKK
jgi:hypothetical protein